MITTIVNYQTKEELRLNLRFKVKTYIFHSVKDMCYGKPFIVLVDNKTNLTICYTRFEEYLTKTRNKNTRNKNTRKEKTLRDMAYNVCSMLNYFFIDTNSINDITELTIKMLENYFNWYSLRIINGRRIARDTVVGSMEDVTYFLVAYINTFLKESNFQINSDELFVNTTQFVDGKVLTLKIPNLGVKLPPKTRNDWRHFPHTYLNNLLLVARRFKPWLELPIASEAFTGSREGEVCNYTMGSFYFAPDSLGIEGDITIDLTEDAVFPDYPDIKIGSIKKYRKVTVLEEYKEEYKKIYNRYLFNLEERLKHKEKGIRLGNKSEPFFYNSQGKPLTAAAYQSALRDLFYNYFIPEMEKQIGCRENYVDRAYIKRWKKRYPGAHCLRHWFTMEMVILGYSPEKIQSMRGDSSIETANIYIHLEGLKKRHEETIFKFQEGIVTNLNERYK